jgi:hypothetical protein
MAGKTPEGPTCKLCGTRCRKKASYCGECGQPLAAQKTADALAAAGFYAETSPEQRDVIYKTAAAGAAAFDFREMEVQALREYRDSPDPGVRLTVEQALQERGAA